MLNILKEHIEVFNKIQNNGNSENREHFFWDSTFRLKLQSSSEC